ncbi:MAG: LIC_13355 family lipoprotein [Leptospiraceae bacterium]|nr:LIC_13355 family lipoprotein [Leptospiraceae bacterium]
MKKITTKSNILTLMLPFFFLLNCGGGNSPDRTAELLLLSQLTTGTASTTSNSSVTIPESFADTVTYPTTSGQGFKNTNNAVNGVYGSGCCVGSLSVYSLDPTGDGASITLEWKGKKVTNGTGIDFVVFENAFQQGTNSNTVFMEATIVEVSNDNANYCGFSPNYTNSPETTYSNNPSHWSNFGGIKPVYYNESTNKLTGDDVFDTSKAGGDGFDLDNLTSNNYYNTGCSDSVKTSIQTNGFIYLKLTSASARINPDTGANFLRDSGAFDGPDIDGAAARYLQSR